MRTLTVLRPGGRTTVQDLGRPGNAYLGVGRSGAADRRAFGLANRVLGNPPSAACLETTLGGLSVRVSDPAWLCVTGPRVEVTVDGAPVGHHTAFYVPAGATVAVGVPARGMRNYLGVRGGIDLPPLLGSRATDLLGGIGPEPLREGDVLPVGPLPDDPPAGIDVFPVVEPTDVVELVVGRGPRIDWFTDEAWPMLLRTEYVVTADSDRIGVRLDGPPLPRARNDELPSEGLMQGAVQIPPIGTPVCFLADTPTTGGYPVIAVVRQTSLSDLAQARPGQGVRFRPG
ncbi:biotin-dependent carboxyltransferase family protein [Blastococcus sp. Marseille-P5729]|uniref:5-oxoprolinase subunit C family protein n=1 Tax=Blastococcus sp. Marseille-P5729 TaxID=2086582 RepID=UPI000D0F769F|nr:biotin-dependent carboxyltransferase family protein [Blastococcus sp. Marseille-P5729]